MEGGKEEEREEEEQGKTGRERKEEREREGGKEEKERGKAREMCSFSAWVDIHRTNGMHKCLRTNNHDRK